MSSDREKLLSIMDSLEADYKAGKLSAEKYSYFRSKYEDKLNAIDARDATKRIRSMQGKSSSKPSKEKRSLKPAKNKKDNEQDLVQKYIINPKKDDAKYNKKKKKPMDSGTFKLLLLLVLVLGFTVGVGYGVFNLDFNSISNEKSVAMVQDTAFPEFHQDKVVNTTVNNHTQDNNDYNQSSQIETTTDQSQDSQDRSRDYDYDPANYDDGGDGGRDSGQGGRVEPQQNNY